MNYGWYCEHQWSLALCWAVSSRHTCTRTCCTPDLHCIGLFLAQIAGHVIYMYMYSTSLGPSHRKFVSVLYISHAIHKINVCGVAGICNF